MRSLPAMSLLLSLLAAPAVGQGVPPQPTGDFGCRVDYGSPCRGKVNFDEGRSYEFRIAGPGAATFRNEGNKRCILEYSITESTIAATGRQMNLAPGQTFTLDIRDKASSIIRFFYRGNGSIACDLMVTLAGWPGAG